MVLLPHPTGPPISTHVLHPLSSDNYLRHSPWGLPSRDRVPKALYDAIGFRKNFTSALTSLAPAFVPDITLCEALCGAAWGVALLRAAWFRCVLLPQSLPLPCPQLAVPAPHMQTPGALLTPPALMPASRCAAYWFQETSA